MDCIFYTSFSISGLLISIVIIVIVMAICQYLYRFACSAKDNCYGSRTCLILMKQRSNTSYACPWISEQSKKAAKNRLLEIGDRKI